MKRMTFSIAAPVLLGLCLSVCGAASAQGGHAQPNVGGGPPGGGTPAMVVGQATAAITSFSMTVGNSNATANLFMIENSDNEGNVNANIAYCVATDQTAHGSFDYSCGANFINNGTSATTVTWTFGLGVNGYFNSGYRIASASSAINVGSSAATVGSAGSGQNYNVPGTASGTTSLSALDPNTPGSGTASAQGNATGDADWYP